MLATTPSPSPTTLAQRGTPAYRQITQALFLAGLCTFTQLYFLQPLLPVVARYYHVTPARSSLVISAGTSALAVGLLLGAFLADRYPRKQLMGSALVIASLLTIASAAAPTFGWLLALSAGKGFALAGVAAIAMAYLGEEVGAASLSRSMGLYITGTIGGGMLGRVLATLLTGWFSWRVVAASIGLGCLAVSLEFVRRLPPSRHFQARSQPGRALLATMLRAVQDPVLLGLCCFAALAMGSFVSVYNYLGFRLEAPPFALSSAAIASIFVLYAVGMGGSAAAGPLAEKSSLPKALMAMAGLMLGGLLATAATQLLVVLVGLSVFTWGFFGAHTLASTWVGSRTPANRSAAASLYLLFYYVGSSFVGTGTGLILQAYGWPGVVWLLGSLLGAALLLTLSLYLLSLSQKR